VTNPTSGGPRRASSLTPSTVSFAPATHPAAGWLELAEQVLICARLLRDALSPWIIRRGLAEAEFAVLWACRQPPPGGLAQHQLAARLTVSAGQISGQVEKLRRRGLLHGRRSRHDRRRRLWRLTRSGRDVVLGVLDDLAASTGPGIINNADDELTGRLDRLAAALGTRPGNRSSAVPPGSLDQPSGRRGAA